ncbi:late competence development ComFB family protein [Succinimonas amylolytica]|uniref:late competence development ComFB family protein n=1 Tax=Succinimonas amylolytica TaxID=83769 RepID=UPI00036EC1E0|nr:late competence development ComFB family protein [Succinimonas amylolytica]
MATIEEVHNYYEKLVRDYINALELAQTRDTDYLTDLFCMTLNRLPALYVRYDVDMLYFTSDEKRQEMDDMVIRAVTDSIAWLDEADHKRDEYDKKGEELVVVKKVQRETYEPLGQQTVANLLASEEALAIQDE